MNVSLCCYMDGGGMATDVVTIKLRKNGPLEIRGEIVLLDADNNPVEARYESVYYLCRCGFSATRPFCDGAHNEACWDESSNWQL